MSEGVCICKMTFMNSRAQSRPPQRVFVRWDVQYICILSGICLWVLLLLLRAEAGSISLQTRSSTGKGVNSDVQGLLNDSNEARRHVEVERDRTDWFSSSISRLLLESEVNQNTVVLGLMNEDGSFNSGLLIEERDENWDAEDSNLVSPNSQISTMEGTDSNLPGFTGWSPSLSFTFEKCSLKMKDFIPCLDYLAPTIAELGNKGGERERQCPPERVFEKLCLVAKPLAYKAPIRWPRSKDEVFVANLPQPGRTLLNRGLVSIEADKWKFPTTASQFPEGVNAYVDHLAQMVPDLAFGVRTRTVLDIGCGVASFGAALLDRGVLPLSISPKDDYNNGVQFALERGLPAMVANLATRRLPYPSQAFDLIHCSDSAIKWTRNGKASLLEVDRILRSGGYFAWWVAPVIGNTGKDAKLWRELLELTGRMCWTLVSKDGRLAIWQKSLDQNCYENRVAESSPPLCSADDDLDNGWYAGLDLCVSRTPSTFQKQTLDWPARLSVLPERTGISVMEVEESEHAVFLANQRLWNEIVEGYLRGLGMRKGNIRNVMDMRAGFGGFAAALVEQNPGWWVLNVVPPYGPNTLPIIYDRGLIGVAHDWCEPFDTYPRTYDLLHAVGVFSAEEKRCNVTRMIFEMDRILRPYGWVLIRESKGMAERLRPLATAVRWKTRILETESGPYGKDKLLACVKRK